MKSFLFSLCPLNIIHLIVIRKINLCRRRVFVFKNCLLCDCDAQFNCDDICSSVFVKSALELVNDKFKLYAYVALPVYTDIFLSEKWPCGFVRSHRILR